MAMVAEKALESIEAALIGLASVCDGASSRDDRGFNGSHARWGKRLASRLRGGQRLYAEEYETALERLPIYHRQLAEMGIELPSQEELEKVLVSYEEPEEAPKHFFTVAEDRLAIHFPYDAALVGQVKSFETARWNGSNWTVNWIEANAVVERFESFAISDEVEAKLQEWAERPLPKPEPVGKVQLVGSSLIVTFKYSADRVATIKAIKEELRAVRWDSEGKFWQFPLSAAEKLAAAFPEFEFDSAIQSAIQNAQQEALSAQAEKQAALQRLIDAAKVDEPLSNGRTLYQHQREAVKWAISQIESTDLRGVILALDMGLGKAQKLDSKILTPDGWVQMGDIRVGDFVIGSDGNPIQVTGVYPQGLKKVYRVTFTDDSSVECCDEHLWAVRTPVQKYRGEDYRVMSLGQIVDSGLTHKSGNLKYYIPMVKPVQFSSRALPLDPYVLGVLLGDGTLDSTSVSWAKPQPELATMMAELLPDSVKVVQASKDVYRISRISAHERNPVVKAICDLGLDGKRSSEKFIPDLYKFSNVEDRVAILQGLLDTDGSCSQDGIVIDYGSTSKQLAEDVQFLVESLGGSARMTIKNPWYTYQGERKQGQTFYRLNVSLPADINPFRLSVKRDRYKPRTKYQPSRAIQSVEYIGEFQCQCISVDALDSLYVTEHCIVTHNTLTSLATAKAYQRIYDVPVFVVCPASLKDNWYREAEMVELAIEVFSWAKMPSPLDTQEYVLIADESHYAQAGSKSKRGQAFIELASNPNCKASLLLTGTPIKNGRPSNLFPLLKAVGHDLAKNKREYEIRYCAAKPTRFCPWDVTGAAHLDELHAKTKDVILRRTKAECLDLPEKTRVFREAEVSSDRLKLWKAAYKEAQEEYESNRGMNNGEALVLLGKLRKAASHAKVETAIALAEEILEQGQQVVLFTEFLDSARELHKVLGGELLIGETPVEERQPMVERFQSGKSKVFISTSRAGGVGITLTASQVVIMVDRPWTPGDAVQCEDRCHRIGQSSSVTAIWLQFSDIDIKVDSILEQKQERIELVLQGKRKTLRGIKNPMEAAKEIAQAILKK